MTTHPQPLDNDELYEQVRTKLSEITMLHTRKNLGVLDNVTDDVVEIFRQAHLATLERLKEAGPKDTDQQPIVTPTEWLEGNRAGFRQANTLWHQAIDSEIRKIKDASDGRQ